MIIPFNLYNSEDYSYTYTELYFNNIRIKDDDFPFLPSIKKVSSLNELSDDSFILEESDQYTTLLLLIRIYWSKNISLYKYKGRYLVRDILFGKKSGLVKNIRVEAIQDPIIFDDDKTRKIKLPISLSEFPENYWLTNIFKKFGETLCI